MYQLKDIFESLHQQQVKYLLCGGMAVNLYGIPRMTADMDVIIEMTEENIALFEAVIKEAGYKSHSANSYTNENLRAVMLNVVMYEPEIFNDYWDKKDVRTLANFSVNVLSYVDLMHLDERVHEITQEQFDRHSSLSTEEVLDWIQQSTELIYEMQTPEERERKYIFKPNKRPIKGLHINA